MATIQSLFGDFAKSEHLQILVDKSQDLFAPTWFQRFFDFGPQQVALDYTTIIGASRIEAAASVIARGSTAPLRSRADLGKLSGEIPPIAEKFKMQEKEYRNYLTLQSMAVSDTARKDALLELLWNDVKNVGNAAMKRVDAMCLEGVSTGKITLTTTNNPDGAVTTTDIDLLMPTGNKINAAVDWGTAATATPITDFETVRDYQSERGRSIEKVLMTRGTFNKMKLTTQVKDYFQGYSGRSNNKVIPTLDNVNEFLVGQGLPVIEIVDVPVGIEKDGVISTIRPFKNENVVFIPGGKLGIIHNAFAVEEFKKVEKVGYAKFNRALISKWQENEPWAEFTKVELNAFPGIDVDGIVILSSNVAF